MVGLFRSRWPWPWPRPAEGGVVVSGTTRVTRFRSRRSRAGRTREGKRTWRVTRSGRWDFGRVLRGFAASAALLLLVPAVFADGGGRGAEVRELMRFVMTTRGVGRVSGCVDAGEKEDMA